MENQYTGDLAIGFEGVCRACKKSERAYYLYADRENRKRMKDGQFMNFNANCPACVTRPFFQVHKSMEFKRKLTPKEVNKDLIALRGGINIDFDEADRQEKYMRKMDDEVENINKRTQEYLGWKGKRL